MILAIKEASIGLRSFRKNVPGMLSVAEGLLLYKLAAKLPKNSVGVEIGTFAGRSAGYILKGMNRKNSFLYSIDLFDRDMEKSKNDEIQKRQDFEPGTLSWSFAEKKFSKAEVEAILKKVGFSGFELICGSSHKIAKKWDKEIDFLWVDGSHVYDDVKKDFLLWSKFLKKGGVIAFHDSSKKDSGTEWNMGWPGPTRVVNEFIRDPEWINIGKADSITYATKNF